MGTLTVAVVQQKGGSGKTTLSVNLGACAHLAGFRSVIVDLDPQGSAFDWSEKRPEGSRLDGLAVVQAAPHTEKLEREGLKLARYAEITQPYEVAFLDGSRIGAITQSAAVAADIVLMPIQPGGFDFWAMEDTLAAIDRADQVREHIGRGPVHRAFVLNRAAVGTRLARDAAKALRGAEFVGVVHQRVAFGDTSLVGESVLSSPAASLAAAEIEKLWRALRKIGTNGRARIQKAQHGKDASHGGETRRRVSKAVGG